MKPLPLLHSRRIFLWLAVATLVLLLVPLVAMQFTAQVRWSGLDFAAMAVLIMGFASTFVMLARRQPNRLWLAVVMVLAFLLFWALLAVGV